MADTKYGHYLKELEFDDKGIGFFKQIAKVSGDSLGVKATIEFGTYIAAGKMGDKPYKSRVRDHDQVLLWLGTGMDDLSELGAEVECCLGKEEEKEKYIFTCSSAVAVPRGLPFFPATINRMDRRILFMTVTCAPENEMAATVCDEDVAEPDKVTGWFGKYNANIQHIPFVRKGAWHYGPNNRDDAGGTISEIDYKEEIGFRFNMSHESIKKAPYRFGPVPDVPHVHNYHEFLLFLGADPYDISDLGAEIEICLGREEEKHVVTKPTAAIMPVGFPHCPVTITRVDKPFIFSVVRPYGPGKTTPLTKNRQKGAAGDESGKI